MTDANPNTVWARAVAEELVTADVDTVCIAPGSRSTPLTLACADHDALSIHSVLDERSLGYFALGRARHTGSPTPVITTSGTATANLHPAVMEADTDRVPMLLLTADRPPERQDSGANQTVDQTKLYGDAVRWFHGFGLPDTDPTALRALRTTIHRAVATSTGVPEGPVHLNVPFRKPLEPTTDPDNDATTKPTQSSTPPAGSVTVTPGTPTLSQPQIESVGNRIAAADRPLLVCGPMAAWNHHSAIADLATTVDAPLIADPLSGLRFGPHVTDTPVIGHYDAYLTDAITTTWPDPDFVVRFGASPTSKRLRHYLADTDAPQFLVDPAGGWREAEFTTTNLLTAAPEPTATALTRSIDDTGAASWRNRWEAADTTTAAAVTDLPYFEGTVLPTVTDALPDDAVLFVSNSTPVRDLDRFTTPDPTPITALGNRGASGIDGITSTALGAGSTTANDLVLVTGDLAFYHDMNGLLTIDRCDLEATIVLINNDGGGIFHRLPIADYDPAFTDHFQTPHGLEFDAATSLYDLDHTTVQTQSELRTALEESLDTPGSTVIETVTDAADSQSIRDRFTDRLTDRIP